MGQFNRGFKYPFTSFGLLLKPGIRLYVLIPFIINTLLFTLAIIYTAGHLNEFINNLTGRYEWLSWLRWLLWPVFIILAFTFVFFCFAILANLIGAPFNGFLAEAVEQSLSGELTATADKPGLWQATGQAIRSEAQKLIYFAIRALPLLLLFLVPVVQLAAPLIWLLFSAWALALEYADYPLGNHDLAFREQRKKLASNRPLVFGFGFGVLLLTMTPVLNFIAMPAAVIGATRMYLTHFKAEIPAAEGASGGHS